MLQVMLINAVKDVASALRDLIGATKNAAGKQTSDPAMNVLKESAKVGSPRGQRCLHYRSRVF